jgi:cysteinyl-tRNA synthetase
MPERQGEVVASILYRAIRLGYINAKYSSELDFTFDKIDSNITVIKSIDETLKLVNRNLSQLSSNIRKDKATKE